MLSISAAPTIIICDICPRRCLRASEEERQESELLYQTLMSIPYPPNQPYPRLILKSVPLPENIRFPESASLKIGDDSIVVYEEVCRGELFVSIAARLMPLSYRLVATDAYFTWLRSDKRKNRMTLFHAIPLPPILSHEQGIKTL